MSECCSVEGRPRNRKGAENGLTSYGLDIGDVFRIAIDPERVGFGQVVGRYLRVTYYLAVFDFVASADEPVDVDAIVQRPLLFLALSMDAKVHAGHWTIVGRAPVPPNLPMPAYKELVGAQGRVDVVDYSGKRRRPATLDESSWLSYRKVVAPVRLEKALRAWHGNEAWSPTYEELKPPLQATSARLFNDEAE